MHLRDAQHILRGNRLYALTVRVEVVGRQTEDLHVGQSSRHFGGGLEADREHAHQIARGQRQFGIAHRRFADAREFERDLAQCIRGDRGLHGRRNFERAGRATPIER